MKIIARAFLLSLVALVLCTSTVLADGERFYVDELHMSLTAPDGWIKFTQTIDPNDPNLDYFTLTAQEMEDNLAKMNVYVYLANITPIGSVYIIDVSKVEQSDVYDIRTLSDNELTTLADATEESLQGNDDMEQAGITYLSHGTYTNKKDNYIIYNCIRDNADEKIYSQVYTTIVNGQGINIVLNSYDGEISDELKDIQKAVVDSVVFDEIPNPNGKDASSVLSATTDDKGQQQTSSANNSSYGTDLWTDVAGKVLLGIVVSLGAGIGGLVRAQISKRKKRKQEAAAAPRDANDRWWGRGSAEEPRKPRLCAQCGTELPNGSKFCNRCGAEVSKSTENG